MDPQQQQTKQGIQPSLAELDKPNSGQQNQQQDDSSQQQQDDSQKQDGSNQDNLPPDGQNQNDQTDSSTEDGDNLEEVDPMEFYNEITKLRGDNLKWEFPEDIDPHSPAGVHYAMQLVVDNELKNFEESLYKRNPRGYAYMLHRDNGGTDEEFFATKTVTLPEWETLKGSVDLQQQFYRRVLALKELPADQIEMLVKDAIEKNKLQGLVEADYNRIRKQEEDQANELLRINEQNQNRQKQLIQRMGTVLQEKIIDNKGLGITIPDAKRGNFLQFVNQMVHLDATSGRFYIQQEINQDNINSILESLYYMSVGGNMDEIISNKAKVQNTKRLLLNMKRDRTKNSSQSNPNTQTQKPGVQPPLKDI